MSRFRQSHSLKRMSVSTSYLNLISVLNPWIFGDALFALKSQKLQFSNIQKRLDILKNATCREGYMNIWRCGRDWIRSGRDLMGARKDKPKRYLAHQFQEMDLIWNSILCAQACPFVTWPQDSSRKEISCLLCLVAAHKMAHRLFRFGRWHATRAVFWSSLPGSRVCRVDVLQQLHILVVVMMSP